MRPGEEGTCVFTGLRADGGDGPLSQVILALCNRGRSWLRGALRSKVEVRLEKVSNVLLMGLDFLEDTTVSLHCTLKCVSVCVYGIRMQLNQSSHTEHPRVTSCQGKKQKSPRGARCPPQLRPLTGVTTVLTANSMD